MPVKNYSASFSIPDEVVFSAGKDFEKRLNDAVVVAFERVYGSDLSDLVLERGDRGSVQLSYEQDISTQSINCAMDWQEWQT